MNYYQDAKYDERRFWDHFDLLCVYQKIQIFNTVSVFKNHNQII